MSEVKIFVVYHKPYTVFKSEVFEPIQTGADFSGIDLGFLKDNTGDNIAEKNPYYGELTAWYWVAHNWLPFHPEVKYVGFCHYRRFLRFMHKAGPFSPAEDSCTAQELSDAFRTTEYSTEQISRMVAHADVILPPKMRFVSFDTNFRGDNVYFQFAKVHPVADLNAAIRYYQRGHPVTTRIVEKFFSGTSFYQGLNFVMRRDLFLDLQKWMLDFLDGLSAQCDWSKYHDYNSIRTPAYIAERFFNVWLAEQKYAHGLKLLELRRLVVDPIPKFKPDSPLLWYLSGVKQYCLWKYGQIFHPNIPEVFR